MINEDYHESILLFNATSKTKNGRKLEYDYLYKKYPVIETEYLRILKSPYLRTPF